MKGADCIHTKQEPEHFINEYKNMLQFLVEGEILFLKNISPESENYTNGVALVVKTKTDLYAKIKINYIKSTCSAKIVFPDLSVEISTYSSILGDFMENANDSEDDVKGEIIKSFEFSINNKNEITFVVELFGRKDDVTPIFQMVFRKIWIESVDDFILSLVYN